MRIRHRLTVGTLTIGCLIAAACGANDSTSSSADTTEAAQTTEAAASVSSDSAPTSVAATEPTPTPPTSAPPVTEAPAPTSTAPRSTAAPATTAPPTTASPTTAAPAATDLGSEPAATTPDAAVTEPRQTTVVPLGTVFATADGIELVVPAAEIEVIGYHEANHDGTRQMQPVDSPVPYRTLDSRNRGTQSRTAADMVVNPNQPVYSPVTGTVLRAGGYVLYCEHDDDFLVIEPDGRPGIEVKLLHINGVTVGAGDRVEAGVTLVAPGPTPLPFESQVDEFTGEPSWAHVHVEVVDTSIPDVPAPGGGSSC